MKILGIETSCDETAIAIIEASGDIKTPKFNLLGSALHSQIEMHREYGGVYPNVAKREHIKNLPIVLEEAFKQSNTKIEDIDMIAVTVGPGLEPALWTGITFAKELSEKYKIPLIPTNHMEGHIVSVIPRGALGYQGGPLVFPAITLLISGGHTELILIKDWNKKEILGQTKDDAVGEAFDKVARMLGLPYPGGPEISKLAEKARKEHLELETKFPRSMMHSGDYNFSFSGLKTAVLYFLRKENQLSEELKKKVAREFEDAVTEVLVSKSTKAINEFKPKSFIVGGGVIANNHIRQTFENHFVNNYKDLNLFIPEKSLTTDNAVMIAMAGYLTYLSDRHLDLRAQGNLKIE